jgi:hypothetical protein
MTRGKILVYQFFNSFIFTNRPIVKPILMGGLENFSVTYYFKQRSLTSKQRDNPKCPFQRSLRTSKLNEQSETWDIHRIIDEVYDRVRCHSVSTVNNYRRFGGSTLSTHSQSSSFKLTNFQNSKSDYENG